MSTKKITLLAVAIALSASTSIVSADKGDKVERHLDRKGDRIERHLDRKGDRIDNRLDRKGDRIENRFDNKADRATRCWQRWLSKSLRTPRQHC